MKILSADMIKTAEENAVQNGIFSYVDLMQNASKALFEELTEEIIKKGMKTVVVCGAGNNGGDGLCFAKLLKDNGYDVSVVLPLGEPKSYPATEFLPYLSEIPVLSEVPPGCDVLVDALFGIGLNRKLDGEALETVQKMNFCKAFKIAVDIPSGVSADAGMSGFAFNADITLTFIALKMCFVLPVPSEFCGDVKVLDIGVEPDEYMYTTTEMPKRIYRPKNSHKGTYGTVLTVTGSYGMCGASVLSAKSALVSGVGMVKSFVCDKNYTAFNIAVPEAVTIPVETLESGVPYIDVKKLSEEMLSANVLLLGCGIGHGDDSKRLVRNALEFANIPIVIDADGINIIAGNIELLKRVRVPVVITPHSKEMARLCKTTVEEVENNRPMIAKNVAVNTGAVVVLKGANTVIASPDGKIVFNMTGNSGMSVAGSGDVLSGIIAARIALGQNPFDAAKDAVFLHGLAGDRLKERYSLEGILPTDIIAELKTIKF